MFHAIKLLLISLTTFSFAAAPLTPSSDTILTERVTWTMNMSQLVAFQPSRVGWKRFAEALAIKPLSPIGMELSRNARLVAEWPTLKQVGDSLELRQGKVLVTITKGSDGLKANGRLFSLDTTKPVLPQVQQFLQAELAESHVSFSLFPVAQAADDKHEPGPGTVGGMMIGGVAGVFAAIATALPATALIDAGIITGANAMAVAFVMPYVVALGVFGGVVYCGSQQESGNLRSGRRPGQSFVNCLTAPLSLLGINPRDRLYLDGLDCKPNGAMKVRLASTTGIVQERLFAVSDGHLQSVEIRGDHKVATLKIAGDDTTVDSAATVGEGVTKQLARPRDRSSLDKLQPIVRDYELYRSLCANPDRLKDLLAKSKSSNDKHARAFDSSTPEQIDQSGHENTAPAQ